MDSLRIVCTAFLLVLVAAPSQASILRVNPAATGVPIDGSSWDNAYRTLQDALIGAATGDEIWVVAGTYTPVAPSSADRVSSFLIPSGVDIYGGFSVADASREQRDPQLRKTILSGDVDGNDVEFSWTDNSFHVLRFAGGDTQSSLDGFEVSGGYGDSSEPDDWGAGILVTGGALAIRNCLFKNHYASGYGGAVYSDGGALEIVSCRFQDNIGSSGGALFVTQGSASLSKVLFTRNSSIAGGAIYIGGSVPFNAVNCVFADNASIDAAGAIYNSTGNTVNLLNCTFSGNRADGFTEGGGALVNLDATVTAVNCIFYGDTSENSAATEFYDYIHPTAITLNNCIVAGGWPAGTNNLDADPRFRSVKEPYPYELCWDSPAINAATSAAPNEDVEGAPRPQNGGSDIGAYEFPTDTDGGGLPDNYETANSFNPNDPADDSADTDGDNLDNLEEYRRGSNPHDPADPQSDFYVSPLDGSPPGDDFMNNGSATSPWQTIGHAMSTIPEGTPTFPITIHLAPGDPYEEAVVFRPYVHLVGSGVDNTTIQYFQASDYTHDVVTAAEKSALSHCTVTLPDTFNETVTLLRIKDVAMEVSDVVFNGRFGTNAIAVLVTAPGSSASTIQYCRVIGAEYGVYAVDSGVNVTRNTFEYIRQTGIFIKPPEGKADGEAATPMLGDSTNVSNTGFNRFNTSVKVFVENITSSTAKAQYNDWGLYTAAEIQPRVLNSPGQVDFEPFLGKSLVRSSIFVQVKDEVTHDPIAQAQHPRVTLGGEADSPDASGAVLYTNMDPGTYTCQATADGYQEASETVSVAQGKIGDVQFVMHKIGGEGEGEGEIGCPRGQIGNAAPNTPLSNYFGDILLLVLASAFLLLARSLPHVRKMGAEISDSTGCSE